MPRTPAWADRPWLSAYTPCYAPSNARPILCVAPDPRCGDIANARPILCVALSPRCGDISGATLGVPSEALLHVPNWFVRAAGAQPLRSPRQNQIRDPSNDESLICVEKRRLERPTPTSRTWCATNCATSRSLCSLRILLKVRYFLGRKAGNPALLYFRK